jgi:REP element-mobilizing transposase RayT
MSLYKNKYRVESTRFDVWDYSNNGYYFVTICTKEKTCYFGTCSDEDIQLNKFGEKTKEIWADIPNQFEDTELDEFVIMPNHVHGIIFISRDLINQISTKKPNIKNNPMLTELSLGKIIRWFKAKTSYEICHKLNHRNFSWQSRFYEHIIRNYKELRSIREYIYNNPYKWAFDCENPHCESSVNLKIK